MTPGPAAIEGVFAGNDWPGAWRNGVYPYHHYHSTAHEALAERVQAGDVAVIPAGVAHRLVESSADFRVAGAYPRGQSPDMCCGEPGERPGADCRIAAAAEPRQDPVQGAGGELPRLWPA